MFCTKCGTQNPDDAIFCIKCGAKMVTQEPSPVRVEPAPVAPAPVPPAQSQQWAPSGQQAPVYPQPFMSPAPQKKKMPKWPFIVGGAVLVVLVLILVVIFGDIGKPKYDYEATLRAYTPYADSQGLPYTFGEVMDKYLEDTAWDVDEKGDGQAVVTVSGVLKGFGEKAEFTYTLTPDPESSGKVKFRNDSVMVNSEKSSWDGAPGWFLLSLYTAYDDGDDELADLSGLLVALGIHEPELTETYVNEEPGVSFKYPSAWQKPSSEAAEALSSLEGRFGTEVFSVMDNEKYLKQFSSFMGVYKYTEPITQDDVDILLGDDDAFIDYAGFDPAVTETSVTKIGTVPVRKVSSDDAENSHVRMYMYTVGSDGYTVLFVRGGKETEQLEHCFDAIMDTYTVTVPEPTPTPEPTPSPTPAPTPTPKPITIIDEKEATYYMEGDNYCEIHLDPLNYYCFDMKVNLYAGIGSCSGVYTVTDEGYHCQIVGEHFRGFMGQDVYEFDLIKTDGGLQYKGEPMGTIRDGTMFYE